MSWSWSAEEDQAMDYLPHAAQVLYLRVLRRRMDFNTGVVGITCRISYQQIGEWLEVRPPWGSKNPVVRLTVPEIRAALVQLERAGLIQRVRDSNGDAMPLVFLLPLASAGLVRVKKEQQEEQQQKQKGTTAISDSDMRLIKALFLSEETISYDSKLLVDKSKKSAVNMDRNNSKNKEEQQEEQQTSGMSSTSLNNNIHLRARGNGCVIGDDWLPSVKTVEQLVVDFGLPPAFLKRKALEFRILWREQNVIALNWDSYFIGACKNRLAERDGDFVSAKNNYSRSDHA